MLKDVGDLARWQAEFRLSPAVWVVEDRDGLLDSIYETKEGAQFAVDHYRKIGIKLHIRKVNIHSDKLARERWVSIVGRFVPYVLDGKKKGDD